MYNKLIAVSAGLIITNIKRFCYTVVLYSWALSHFVWQDLYCRTMPLLSQHCQQSIFLHEIKRGSLVAKVLACWAWGCEIEALPLQPHFDRGEMQKISICILGFRCTLKNLWWSKLLWGCLLRGIPHNHGFGVQNPISYYFQRLEIAINVCLPFYRNDQFDVGMASAIPIWKSTNSNILLVHLQGSHRVYTFQKRYVYGQVLVYYLSTVMVNL